MKKEIVEQYIGRKIEVFLSNRMKFTGHILRIEDNTVVFNDIYDKEIPIECSAIIVIYPKEVKKSD